MSSSAIIKNWPQLYATASTGKTKQWRIWVDIDSNKSAIIHTEHGYIDGKLQHKIKLVKTGKNLGKANETTPFEQAVSEAQSTYNKKIDKKYITEIPTENNVPDFLLPMLAKAFKKYMHKIIWPAMCQRKLNGVRCLAQKISMQKINFTSRKGKSYNETLKHLEGPLLKIMNLGEIFDGEIYLHGWTFQQILRRVKKVRPDTNKLEFWVYDIADKNIPNGTRSVLYENAIPKDSQIKALYCDEVWSEKDVYTCHDAYVKEGYEGAIIRNINALYKFDHRSMDLQKFKKFEDKEFKIIGFKAEPHQELFSDGSYSDRNAIVFICQTELGKQFAVRSRGSIEQRFKWYENGNQFIGLDLTVRFQERSEDEIPIFPVGIAVRDYE